MGLMLQWERRSKGTPPVAIAGVEVARTTVNRGALVAAGIFFSCILGFLGFLSLRTIQSNADNQRRDAAYKRSVAEIPSKENLLPIEPLTPEQALILRDIGNLYAWLPSSRPTFLYPGASGQFEMEYSVGYTTTKDSPPPPASIRRAVAVVVTQYPNAEWSRYYTKYPSGQSVLMYSPGDLTTVKKFGQTIVRDSIQRDRNGDGTLRFLWPSNNFTISVGYETRAIDEQFLQLYLDKYPSSL
jgi:hypothetical protein